MGLCNDNFWGYTTSLLTTLDVRWIEAAIVNSYWTTMLIYYIEGDRGHLMDEVMAEQRSRTVVRGSACTYQMPWEEIVRDLTSRCTDADGTPQLPRSQESLKYFIRVHLTIAGVDMKKYMKQIHVRPFVLVRLVEYLIDSKHEAYHSNQDTADALKAKMFQKIEAEYPETEADLPEGAREGQIPSSIQEVLQDSKRRAKGQAAPQR